jgi:histidyl-tRNA synthetase
MSDQKKKVYKPSPVSGFPEWLPEVRMVEQRWMDIIRAKFESYGYASIETPAVEELAVISAKGEDVDKEIYVIERLQKDEDDKSEARLALHFDQTVPFARYAAQHFNDLVFPFKRYQMQKVWRGERPQAGRMREFYQCDIDVINPDNLPIAFDAEMPAIMWEILSNLPGMENENIQIRVSNRKILIGLCEGLGLTKIVEATRIIDKKDKIGIQSVKKNLAEECGIEDEKIDVILKLAEMSFRPSEARGGIFEDPSAALGMTIESKLMEEGIFELQAVLDALTHLPDGAVVADLSIVRGLDYYTGTVYETVFVEDPTYGSICSGGRYDDLAGSYINKHLPGVGISIGFSRLFDRLRVQGKLPVGRKCPTDILVSPPRDEAQIGQAYTVAQTLRQNGFNVEIATQRKFDKQIGYASKKGIPFLWLTEDNEIKDLSNGSQTKADPKQLTKESLSA